MHDDEKLNNTENSPEFPTLLQALTIIFITILASLLVVLSAISLGFTEKPLYLTEIVMVIPALIYVRRKRFSFTKVFRLRLASKEVIWYTILIGIGLIIVTDEVDRFIQIFYSMPDNIYQELHKSLIMESLQDYIIIIFSAVFLAAICEEMLFRGFLQTSLENTFDITKSVMLTALIFAIVHFNQWWTIQLIIFGIFLGVLAWKTNSIIPSIIVHFLNNGVALLFTNLDESQVRWYLWKDHVNPVLLLAALLCGIYGFKKLYKYYEETSDEQH